MENIYLIKKGTTYMQPVPKATYEKKPDIYKGWRKATTKELAAVGITIEKPVKPEPIKTEKTEEKADKPK